LDLAVRNVGAKRVVIDTLEVLFSGLDDTAMLRAELRRLFRWLNDRGLTAMVTAERGERSLTRFGFEEYVSDCVITLDHRVIDQLATRRLRIVKFRGSAHGLNEYPYLIDDEGISVVPITSFDLSYPASTDVISTGIDDLDAMFAPGGLFRGTTTMISGGSGTGKTTFAASIADAACARGEDDSVLRVRGSRWHRSHGTCGRSVSISRTGTDRGNAARRARATDTARPRTTPQPAAPPGRADAPVDRDHRTPITDFQAIGSREDIKSMVMRMVDFLKQRNVDGPCSRVSRPSTTTEDPSVSSLIDTWIQLANEVVDGTLCRSMYVRKSRGMAHSGKGAGAAAGRGRDPSRGTGPGS
jgi:circadian clock protein KaiC